jgi:2-oxoglutarate dehydrogenase E2 component (dihydrolipoamide succinyltransferase)
MIMPIEIRVPELGESITEVQIAAWLVKEGDLLARDQDLVSIDSEKATVNIPAPTAGKLTKILKSNGQTAVVGEGIGLMEPNGGPEENTPAPRREEKPVQKPASAAPIQPAPAEVSPAEGRPGTKEGPVAARAAPTPVAQTKPMAQPSPVEHHGDGLRGRSTGPGGRLLKRVAAPEPEPPKVEPTVLHEASAVPGRAREESVQPMSLLRRTLSSRLVEARQAMAILTTFNEIDMSAVIALREQCQAAFQAKHQAKLGFMSFFVKAALEGLQAVPQLNAEIRGTDIVYHRYYDIGVAIATGRGLVVPPLRNAERMSCGEIERTIADLAARAQAGTLKPEELTGGTFTISNGGVFGSLLSTPIINPPQTGILGLHAIQDRPVAREGQVVIRPMMYVALSYDHRLVDGREAVTFLRLVKEIIEMPARLVVQV